MTSCSSPRSSSLRKVSLLNPLLTRVFDVGFGYGHMGSKNVSYTPVLLERVNLNTVRSRTFNTIRKHSILLTSPFPQFNRQFCSCFQIAPLFPLALTDLNQLTAFTPLILFPSFPFYRYAISQWSQMVRMLDKCGTMDIRCSRRCAG